MALKHISVQSFPKHCGKYSLRQCNKDFMTIPGFLRILPDGLLLSIKLQPRASANQIGEPLGNELRVKVTAPPVDAAANEALLRLLADILKCPRGQVELVRGHTSRHKVIKLHGLEANAVLARLISHD
jgi:hypothetical protein